MGGVFVKWRFDDEAYEMPTSRFTVASALLGVTGGG